MCPVRGITCRATNSRSFKTAMPAVAIQMSAHNGLQPVSLLQRPQELRFETDTTHRKYGRWRAAASHCVQCPGSTGSDRIAPNAPPEVGLVTARPFRLPVRGRERDIPGLGCTMGVMLPLQRNVFRVVSRSHSRSELRKHGALAILVLRTPHRTSPDKVNEVKILSGRATWRRQSPCNVQPSRPPSTLFRWQGSSQMNATVVCYPHE